MRTNPAIRSPRPLACHTAAEIQSDGSRPLLVCRREAARLLGVSPGTIDNLRRRGGLPSVRIGVRRLYDVADLQELIRTRKGVGP